MYTEKNKIFQDISKESLTVTKSVFEHLEELANKKPDTPHLFISVEGGGCAGFSYNYAFVSEPPPESMLITQNNISIFIDTFSLEKFLNGATVDYVRELGSSYFSIITPNTSSKCGCGNSFSPK